MAAARSEQSRRALLFYEAYEARLDEIVIWLGRRLRLLPGLTARLSREIAGSTEAATALHCYERYESLVDRGASGAAAALLRAVRRLPPDLPLNALGLLFRLMTAMVGVLVTLATALPRRTRRQEYIEPLPATVAALPVTVAGPLPAPRAVGFGQRMLVVVPLVASIAVLGVVYQAYATASPRLVLGADILPAPALVSLPLEDATLAASAQGLQVVVGSVAPTDDLPKDTVVTQVPAAGGRVRRGGTVKLTLSAGLRAPDVLGKPLDQARLHLVRQGWTLTPNIETRLTNGSPPDVVMEQRPGPEEVTPQKTAVTLVVAAPNLAYARPGQTSAGGKAGEAVDGQMESVARLAGKLPNWIEIDFGQAVSVAAVQLHAALGTSGPLTVELWAWDSANQFAPLHLFNESVSAEPVLEVRLPKAASGVTRLRVAATAAPGPLGWREIVVLER
jgi:hypothetical protein